MLAAALALVMALTGLQAQPPGQPRLPGQEAAPSTDKRSAVIKGRITAADSGRPLRRAQIRVAALEFPEGRTTSTNTRGEYEIKDLPAGRYSITVSRSGYLQMLYGQRRFNELGKPLQLDEGQKLERVDFALPRAGVIGGRITDETGEPVSGVAMWAMRTEYFRGRKRLVPVGAGRSDDTGQYRMLGLPPGEYIVMATLRETWVAGPERHTFGYAPSFFAGTASGAEATRVKVGVGQETANTDFSLVAGRAATVSGTAMRSDGTPLSGAQLSIGTEVIGPNSSSFSSSPGVTVAPDGSWSIKNVAPGDYKLEVSTTARDKPIEKASMAITVQGPEVSGIALVTDPGGIVSGLVVTEDGRQLPQGPGRMRVFIDGIGERAGSTLIMSGDDNGIVGADGSFTFKGASGPSIVTVSQRPSGWMVKSIELGGRDQEAPIDVRGRVDGLRIVLTNRTTRVTGRLSDDKGNAGEGTVLLFPADASRWFDNSLLRTARPDQSGLFRLESVRPGEYLAVALEYVQGWQVQDPEFLEELRSLATSVTINEGATNQLDLKIKRQGG